MAGRLQASSGTVARTQRWFATEHGGAEAPFVSFVTTATVPQQLAIGEQTPRQEQVANAPRWYQPEDDWSGTPPFAVTTATAAQEIAATKPDDTPQVWRDSTRHLLGADSAEPVLPPPAATFDATTAAGLWQEQPQDWRDGTPWSSRADDDDDDGFIPLANAYAGADLAEYPQTWRDGTPWVTRTEDVAEGFVPLPNAYSGFDLQEQPATWRDGTPWLTPDELAWVAIPNLTVATTDQASGALQPDAEQRDLTTRWYQEPDDQFGAPPTAAAATVDQQSPALQPEQPYANLTQVWFQTDTDALGASPLPNAPTEATLDEQPQLGSVQTWFGPDDAFEGFAPTAAAVDPAPFAGLWIEQPGQDRSLQPVWAQRDIEVLGYPLVSANVLPLDWDAQQDRSTQPLWFQPETEAWTPVPGLTIATVPQLAALWPDASAQQHRAIQPVWFAPEPTHDSPDGAFVVAVITGGRGPNTSAASSSAPAGSARSFLPFGIATGSGGTISAGPLNGQLTFGGIPLTYGGLPLTYGV